MSVLYYILVRGFLNLLKIVFSAFVLLIVIDIYEDMHVKPKSKEEKDD